MVLRKGHIGYSVYFINSGSVSVVLDTDDESVFIKKEAVVLKKGSCFGVGTCSFFNILLTGHFAIVSLHFIYKRNK